MPLGSTYMLTDPQLVSLVDAGRLMLWTGSPGVPIRFVRRMLLTPTTYQMVIKDPWGREPEDKSDTHARLRRRSIHALINKFVEGGKLAPDFDVKALQQTSPEFENLLELRSGPPAPQSRIFTYVFEPGVWIGMNINLRSDLGALGDPRWRATAGECRRHWAVLFGDRTTHRIPRRLSWPELARISDAQ